MKILYVVTAYSQLDKKTSDIEDRKIHGLTPVLFTSLISARRYMESDKENILVPTKIFRKCVPIPVIKSMINKGVSFQGPTLATYYRKTDDMFGECYFSISIAMI